MLLIYLILNIYKMNVKPVIPDLVAFLLGVIVLGLYACNDIVDKETFIGAHRVIIAMSAAAVSMALPGVLTLGKPETESRQTDNKINAAGALAVFVVVYLFNPVSL